MISGLNINSDKELKRLIVSAERYKMGITQFIAGSRQMFIIDKSIVRSIVLENSRNINGFDDMCGKRELLSILDNIDGSYALFVIHGETMKLIPNYTISCNKSVLVSKDIADKLYSKLNGIGVWDSKYRYK